MQSMRGKRWLTHSQVQILAGRILDEERTSSDVVEELAGPQMEVQDAQAAAQEAQAHARQGSAAVPEISNQESVGALELLT